jgi:hypothetical protein
MRCSPSVICNVIGDISEALKGRIRELGFGELLVLKIDKLDDRTLGLFLLSCVEENPLRIQIGNRALLISAEVVHQVFGLPASGKSLPNYNVDDKRADLRKLCDAKGLESMFTRRGGNYAGLGVSEVPRWFIEHYANAKEYDVDDWTVQSFLMFVFNALLFSTGNDKMVDLDYLMSACLSHVSEINWCQAIIDDIKFKARDLKDKMSSNDNSTPNVQGCIAFLVVSFYQLFLVCLCTIYYLCCVYHLLLFPILRQLFYLYLNQLYSINHLMLSHPFYIVSALLHTLSPIPCLGKQFYTMSLIFVLYQPFHALPAILMFCQYLIL